jgi:hypothetical protein
MTVLRSDGLEVRMGCQISRHDRYTLCRISVDSLCDLELFRIALAESFLQRVKHLAKILFDVDDSQGVLSERLLNRVVYHGATSGY